LPQPAKKSNVEQSRKDVKIFLCNII